MKPSLHGSWWTKHWAGGVPFFRFLSRGRFGAVITLGHVKGAGLAARHRAVGKMVVWGKD